MKQPLPRRQLLAQQETETAKTNCIRGIAGYLCPLCALPCSVFLPLRLRVSAVNFFFPASFRHPGARDVRRRAAYQFFSQTRTIGYRPLSEGSYFECWYHH